MVRPGWESIEFMEHGPPKHDALPTTPKPVIIQPNEMFWKLMRAINPKLFDNPFPEQGTFFGIDPGETTGVAKWVPTLRDRAEIHLWQLETKNIGQSCDVLEALFMEAPPTHIRHEDYRIYHWLAESQSWSQLHTVRLLGGLQHVYHQHNLSWSEKLAQQAKAFWTDEKLKATNTYQRGMRHSRDAVRHLLYYLAFDLHPKQPA